MSATNQPPPGRHVIYPARYFNVSPTYDKWVKLTIADIHALRREPGFEGQNIYFHLNHPIQYVYLVAPIVGIENLNPKTSLLTLDDSSGSCIDVKITCKPPETLTPGTSNTTIKNLSVLTSLGQFDVVVTENNGREHILDIATVVKVKCTISSFWNRRQLELKRVEVVRDTNAEVAAWMAMVAFRRDVLARPWVLSLEQRDEVDRAIAEEQGAARREERRNRAEMKAKETRRAEREGLRLQHEGRAEKRRREAEKVLDAGALPGSDKIWFNDW